jgi:hypothetical protein
VNERANECSVPSGGTLSDLWLHQHLSLAATVAVTALRRAAPPRSPAGELAVMSARLQVATRAAEEGWAGSSAGLRVCGDPACRELQTPPTRLTAALPECPSRHHAACIQCRSGRRCGGAGGCWCPVVASRQVAGRCLHFLGHFLPAVRDGLGCPCRAHLPTARRLLQHQLHPPEGTTSTAAMLVVAGCHRSPVRDLTIDGGGTGLLKAPLQLVVVRFQPRRGAFLPAVRRSSGDLPLPAR